MNKICISSLFILFSLNSIIAQCDLCKQVLTPMYNTLNVKSDKEYIETLHTVYESDEQTYKSYQRRDGYNLILPDYGTAKYNSNKEKIRSYNSRLKTSSNFSLTQKEYIEIFNQTISDEVRINQLSTFSKCIADCNGKPYLTTTHNSVNEVSIILQLPLNNYNAGKRTKVKNITLSEGLSVKNRNIYKGELIKYGESRTILLERTLNKTQSISLDLRNESFIFAEIPEFKLSPEYEMQWKSTNEKGELLQFVTGEIIIPPIHGTKLGAKKHPITRKRPKVSYVLPGSQTGIINLNLSPENHRIEDAYFSLIQGGVHSENHKILVKDNLLQLEYNINASVAEDLKLKYVVLFQELRKECVANCN